MNIEINEILENLKRIKKNKPFINYKEYWIEVNKAIIEENEIFAKEDEKIRINEINNNYFTI